MKRRRVSVTADKDNYQVLNAAAVTISCLVNDTIGREARRIKTEEWKKENREGMEEVAIFTAQYGSFADENRNW